MNFSPVNSILERFFSINERLIVGAFIENNLSDWKNHTYGLDDEYIDSFDDSLTTIFLLRHKLKFTKYVCECYLKEKGFKHLN